MSIRKIAAIVGACFLALGAVCLLIGKMIGGSMNYNYVVGGNGVELSSVDCINETYDLEPFTDLTVDTTMVGVDILKGDEYKLEIYAPVEMKPEIKQGNGSLSIEQPNVYVSINLTGTNFSPYYRITIPGTDDINVNLSSTSGELTVKDINIYGKINLTSGDADISNLESDRLYVHSTSGEIHVENGRIGDFEIENTSGGVELNGIESKTIKANTTSSEIEYNDVAAEKLITNSTSGDFKGNRVKANNIEVSCTSGEVEISPIGKQSDYDYNIDTNSGDIKIGGIKSERNYSTQNGVDKTIAVNTSSGDIEIVFE